MPGFLVTPHTVPCPYPLPVSSERVEVTIGYPSALELKASAGLGASPPTEARQGSTVRGTDFTDR